MARAPHSTYREIAQQCYGTMLTTDSFVDSFVFSIIFVTAAPSTDGEQTRAWSGIGEGIAHARTTC